MSFSSRLFILLLYLACIFQVSGPSLAIILSSNDSKPNCNYQDFNHRPTAVNTKHLTDGSFLYKNYFYFIHEFFMSSKLSGSIHQASLLNQIVRSSVAKIVYTCVHILIRLVRRQSTRKYTLFCISLLIFGDIQPNPGPALINQSQPALLECLSTAQLINTPSDGHCLLYAMRISIHSHLNININVKQITDFTYEDLLNNSNSYLPFFNTILNIYYDQLYRYFCLKQWNCNIGDIIPLAIANTFNIRIVIKSTQLLPVVIKPFTLSTSTPYIIVHYTNNHYSGSESKQHYSNLRRLIHKLLMANFYTVTFNRSFVYEMSIMSNNINAITK